MRDAIALASELHNVEVAPGSSPVQRHCPKMAGLRSLSSTGLGIAPLPCSTESREPSTKIPKAYGISEPSLSRDLSQAFDRADVATKGNG